MKHKIKANKITELKNDELIKEQIHHLRHEALVRKKQVNSTVMFLRNTL